MGLKENVLRGEPKKSAAKAPAAAAAGDAAAAPEGGGGGGSGKAAAAGASGDAASDVAAAAGSKNSGKGGAGVKPDFKWNEMRTWPPWAVTLFKFSLLFLLVPVFVCKIMRSAFSPF